MLNVNLITVAQFTAYAPEVDVSQFNDPTISGFISRASQVATDYLGYTPVLEVITDELRPGHVSSSGDLVIYPQKVPLVSVSAIGVTKGTTNLTLQLTDSQGNNKYNIDYTKRRLVFPYGEVILSGTTVFTNFFALRGSDFFTKVTYTAGWPLTELPGPILEAVTLIVRDMLSKRFNQAGAERISQGGISLEFSAYNDLGQSNLVKEAKRLLNPYRRIG